MENWPSFLPLTVSRCIVGEELDEVGGDIGNIESPRDESWVLGGQFSHQDTRSCGRAVAQDLVGLVVSL